MIILDTHAWVRWLHPELGQPLPKSLREWLELTDDSLAVSAISCLEIAQLVKKGVIKLPLSLPEWYAAALAESAITCLAMTPEILYTSTILPDIHRDPADRVIIATALEIGAVLVTADETIAKYPNLKIRWNLTDQH